MSFLKDKNNRLQSVVIDEHVAMSPQMQISINQANKGNAQQGSLTFKAPVGIDLGLNISQTFFEKPSIQIQKMLVDPKQLGKCSLDEVATNIYMEFSLQLGGLKQEELEKVIGGLLKLCKQHLAAEFETPIVK